MNQELNIYNVESWLLHHGLKLANRFDLKAYTMMNHLLSSINITRDNVSFKKIVSKISASIHLISIDTDLFFTSDEDQKTYNKIKAFKDNISYYEIDSIHGHDAFLIENLKMSQILKQIF